MTDLHYSTTEVIYNDRLKLFRLKYSSSQKKMFSYFESQWLEGHFNKWQIFRNSPGFANTNSNIESFNATFKRDFTKRIKGSIISSCNKLFNCIIYYSNPANNQWNNSPAFDQVVRDQALKISSTCFTKQGNSGRKFRYTGKVRSFEIRTDDKRCYKNVSCNCPSFVKWALCPHTVAYSNTFLLDIYGKEYRQAKRFETKTKKGAKPKINRTGRFSKASSALNHLTIM